MSEDSKTVTPPSSDGVAPSVPAAGQSYDAGAAESADRGKSWSIAVKTVGKTYDHIKNHGPAASAKLSGSGGEGQFFVSVSPEDPMTSLHEQIEDITGLKTSQQRLIYRGRLIGRGDQAPSTPSASRTASYENPPGTSPSNSTSVDASANANSLATEPNQANAVPEPKIKEIEGLCDGQTIHLMKRREASPGTPDRGGADNGGSNNNSLQNTQTSNGNSPLLSALLGIPEDSASGGSNAATSATPSAASNSRRRWRPASSSRSRSSRRPHYRLTANDLEVQDPGSMESVRQGLMTLHTMIPHARVEHSQQPQSTTSSSRPLSAADPLRANRRWFQGQWIDCRDTVNQWLEATIVDIVEPDEILPPRHHREQEVDEVSGEAVGENGSTDDPTRATGTVPDRIDDSVSWRGTSNGNDSSIHEDRVGCEAAFEEGGNNNTVQAEAPRRQQNGVYSLIRRNTELANDPAISASDMEGRRRLLLEPCDDGDEDDEGGSLAGFRRRSNNEGVQLLLIHYNGWPHRWDEWIRSDSERIRPFRTRTRHPTVSSTMSPMPQSVFHESPSTHITAGGDTEDRAAVLPELARALQAVNSLLTQAIGPSNRIASEGISASARDDHLPWGDHDTVRQTMLAQERLREASSTDENGTIINDNNSDGSGGVPGYDSDGTDQLSGHRNQRRLLRRHRQLRYDRRQLELLAPMLDRLGRTLVDAAPHVVSLASSLPTAQSSANSDSESLSSQEEGDDRDDNEEEFTDTVGRDETGDEEAQDDDLPDLITPNRQRNLSPMSLLNRYGRLDVESALSAMAPASATHPLLLEGVDPDHIDYASGIVNTTRGEVRTGPRSRSRENDDVASLLGAYLAAASLGGVAFETDTGGDSAGAGGLRGLTQLLRDRNGTSNGNGGIDIHIHAVVTAPRANPGGTTTIAALGGTGVGDGAVGLGTGGGNNVRNGNNNNDNGSGILQALFSSPISEGSVASRQGDVDGGTGVNGASDEGYDDLFSDLYSETPTPINPNGEAHPEHVSDSDAAAVETEAVGLHSVATLNSSDDDVSSRIPGLPSTGTGASEGARASSADERESTSSSNGDENDSGQRNRPHLPRSGQSPARTSASSQRSDQDGPGSTRTSSSSLVGWGRLFRRRSSRRNE